MKILMKGSIRTEENISGLRANLKILIQAKTPMYGRLEHNYVSVVPVQFDLTNYKLKKELEKNWDVL